MLIPKRSETRERLFPLAISESSKALDLDTPNREGLVDQSQKITVAARAIAERKAIGHLS